jgi:hypothetical protein
MDRNDQQAIETLFEKIGQVERQSPPRDREAEAFIRERITGQPSAPYYMAQTIVVQEAALEAAQARIEELERQPKGFFGGLFGDSRPAGRAVDRDRGARQAALQQQGGGGFLAGAAQTAMGVAGGVLLANAIGGLFSPSEAQAGQGEQQADEPQVEDAGYDTGGDLGDMDL